MTQRQRRVRIGVLIGTHLLTGAVMALIALSFPALQNWAWAVVSYLDLVCSEVLLVGMWLGLGAARWWARLAGLLAGTVWLGCISLAPAPYQSLEAVPTLAALLGVPVLVVAGSCAVCRRWFAKVEYRSQWQSRSVSQELQFTLKSMIGLTFAVALLLALGKFMRSISPVSEFVIIVFILALLAVLATGMLLWASLGPGRAIVRVPIIVAGMGLLGLLPPYYMGGPAFRFLIWPSLMSLVAVGTAGSLLVVRSCGYRLTRIRSEFGGQPQP